MELTLMIEGQEGVSWEEWVALLGERLAPLVASEPAALPDLSWTRWPDSPPATAPSSGPTPL
jgi:hypothetical protein